MCIAFGSLQARRGAAGRAASISPTKRRVQALLDEARAWWAIGGWNFPFNEHEAGRYTPHWLLHLHLTVTTPDRKTSLKRRPCRATSPQRLRSGERLELLPRLDTVGLGRVFTRRAQLRRTRKGGSAVVLLGRTGRDGRRYRPRQR